MPVAGRHAHWHLFAITREFINEGHWLPYLEFAKSSGCIMYSCLSRGTLATMPENVLFDEPQLRVLRYLFIEINSKPALQGISHGVVSWLHQRRMGYCYTGSTAFILTVPAMFTPARFATQKSYNIKRYKGRRGNSLPTEACAHRTVMHDDFLSPVLATQW